MAERLTCWPLRAKVSVAVLAIVLVVTIGVGAAKQGSSEKGLTTLGAAPPTAVTSSPPSATTTTPATPSTPTPATVSSGPATSALSAETTPLAASDGSTVASLAQLRVLDGSPSAPGYSRDLFPTWLDLDGNGCDAREDTLVAESLVPAEVADSGCAVLDGRWLSIYDGVEITESSDLDVDHLVPLAEAWRSGASGWETPRRAAFANDLSFPHHLIAVTARSNRSKSDSPPNEWRPPDEDSWCRYATAWVTIKVAWSLSATSAERDALGQMLDTC